LDKVLIGDCDTMGHNDSLNSYAKLIS